GLLLPTKNQVVYPDCFTDFKADLLCTYTKAGFECDVVMHQQPPLPKEYGLNGGSTRLQLLTEFFNTPDPVQLPQNVTAISQSLGFGAAMPGIAALPVTAQSFALPDVELQFGSMRMVEGGAFSVGESATNEVRVFKSWDRLEGRTFLIEEVPFPNIEPQLEE